MVATQEHTNTSQPTRVVRRLARTFSDPAGRTTRGAAVALVVGWVASIGVLEAVAPAPDPDAVLPPWDLTLSLLYTFAIMGAAIGLLSRVRLGMMASIAGGGVMVAGSISCWAGGHVGSWILVQFVAGLVLAGLATVFLQRS